MITFDSLTLKAFIEENINFFVESRIQKIQQPTRRELILFLRNKGESRKFYININPQFYHLAFINIETERRRFLEIPLKPPMFCMLLRKHLENAKIIRINQPNYERIFEIYIETFDELQGKIELCLAIELMGKHSNIVLYNTDTNIIIGCAHNIGTEKSREREMAGTLPYIYPPKQKKIDILKIEGEITESLENFFFFSKAFSNQCQGIELKKLKRFVNLVNIKPAVTQDYREFSLYSELLDDPEVFQSVNNMIDEYFSHHIEIHKINSLKQELKKLINKRISKYKKNNILMLKQLEQEEKGDEYRLWGDLIMANLYNQKDYSSSIELFNWKENKNITIELNPQLTLKENANKFYKYYNKSKKSIEKISEMYQTNEIQINYLEQTLFGVENTDDFTQLLEIKNEISPTQEPAKKSALTTVSPLEREICGVKVYIGRNNKENDFIVSKLSKDEDYWFHVHNCAGSHVLLKCSEPTGKMIFECAKLAKEFSTAKNTSKVGIIYTRRKKLKRPPKSPLGYVTYSGEEEIVV